MKKIYNLLIDSFLEQNLSDVSYPEGSITHLSNSHAKEPQSERLVDKYLSFMKKGAMALGIITLLLLLAFASENGRTPADYSYQLPTPIDGARPVEKLDKYKKSIVYTLCKGSEC